MSNEQAEKQKYALERLIQEGARALDVLASIDERWYETHFSEALNRGARALGYNDHVDYIRRINDPDASPFSDDGLPF